MLGHAAAFLALMTGVLGADDPGEMARWAQAPAKLFGIGIGLSYAVAVFMWLARGGEITPSGRGTFSTRWP